MADTSIARATDYAQFLDRKAQADRYAGFDPLWMPEFLFDFQRTIVEWATRKGKAAIFADCGLGKTPMQLVWAENVVRKTQRRVLILTPLAVTGQTLSEARKFGIEAGAPADGLGIAVTNYERLHLVDPREYVAAVCDESSILKNFDGVRRGEITDFMRKLDYRLLCTATAAPNDYIELGTSSEALGELGHLDMLNRFFRNTQNTIKPMVYRQRGKNFAQLDEAAKWRFKGHAETAFWRWVCSWARAIRRPSDVGGDDTRFILPPLVEREQVVSARAPAPGMLFDLPAVGMKEERDEMKRTVQERCERAAVCVESTDQPAVMWCNRNDEGDLLAKMVAGARQVSGADELEEKEETFAAFASGQVRVLVIKPKIGAWGLNWQHCAHMTLFPSHSYEQYYQAVRRCWRFGQTAPVVVDVITTEGGAGIAKNLQRKSQQADEMFSRLVAHMNEAARVARFSPFTESLTVPSWL